MKKREFIKYSGLAIGAMVAGTSTAFAFSGKQKVHKIGKTGASLKLSFIPYELNLKHVFTIASNSRTTTPVVLTMVEYDGVKGFGEASLPPYLVENQKSVSDFLSKLNLSQFNDPFLIEDILDYVDSVASGNHAAKASVDIALNDLRGKLMGQPLYRIFGLNPAKTPNTSFTIGIDTPEVVKQKTIEADIYKVLKIKLGKGTDKEMIEAVRSVTDKPLYVDINQGWTDREAALDMIFWLKDMGIVFIEQPMPKERKDDIAWLTQKSPLPVIADEALQGVEDLLPLKGIYTGINIKLMKCGGVNAALKMIRIARAMDMKILIGCMTETSCAVSAAAQLSPLVDWADLDGNLLINNDCYEGLTVVNGKIVLPDRPGIGIIEKTKLL
jgi:L-Ala-D/L-Glu epimerase